MPFTTTLGRDAQASLLALLDALDACPGMQWGLIELEDTDGSLTAALITWAGSRNIAVDMWVTRPTVEVAITEKLRVTVHDKRERVENTAGDWSPAQHCEVMP